MDDAELTLELDNPELPKKSWIKISKIRTLAVERIGAHICRLEPELIDQIIDGLNDIVGG